MLKPLDSHKPATVTTFYPHLGIGTIRELSKFEFSETDRLSDNYTDMDWFSFRAISVYKRDDRIVGFSSILNRREYYHEDEVRILNRYYESPEMRRTSKVIGDNHVCEMVRQQLNTARQLGYKRAFISRCRSPRHLKKFIETVGKKTNTVWHMGDEKIAVCDPKHDECWQYKAWTELC